ncbi:MAG: hypothetical protein N3E52_06390 [Candidatus Bathyarchaeota archaeon]|nr:hypothetical protein [Candidatus Bathyarchaeota archaeon]MCX8154043.1 hypothetical protein [Candidatus Bathyarchaeota archaeon]
MGLKELKNAGLRHLSVYTCVVEACCRAPTAEDKMLYQILMLLARILKIDSPDAFQEFRCQ